MVDPEHGLLALDAGHPQQQIVERYGTIQILAERLFQHNPAARRQSNVAERAHRWSERGGRQRQISCDRLGLIALRRSAGSRNQVCDGIRLVVVYLAVVQRAHQRVARISPNIGSCVLLQALRRAALKHFVVLVRTTSTNNPEIIGKQVRIAQFGQGRQQKALGKVAGCAEQD